MGNQSQKLICSTFKITFKNYDTGGKIFIWKDGDNLYDEIGFKCKIHYLEQAGRAFLIHCDGWGKRITIGNNGDVNILDIHSNDLFYDDKFYSYYRKHVHNRSELIVERLFNSITIYDNEAQPLLFIGISRKCILYAEVIKEHLSFILRYPSGTEIRFEQNVLYEPKNIIKFKMLHEKVFILYGSELLVYLHGKLIYKMINIKDLLVDECGGLRLIGLNDDEFHLSYALKYSQVRKCDPGTIYIPLQQTTKNNIIKYVYESSILIHELRDIVISYLFDFY